MSGDRDPAHHLRPLKTTTTPKRLLWLDCQSNVDKSYGMFTERFRYGALGTTHYTSRKGERRDTLIIQPTTDALWGHVDRFCIGGRRQVLWCNDLSYQLRISQGLTQLTVRGWRLKKIVLERTASWCLFNDGKRSLMCCDVMSWLPSGIVRGSDSGNNAVKIRDTILDILAWVGSEDLGPFRPTGSGQSYSAFRRRFITHDMLVHDDETRLAAERKAMWTGRCEAWQHGRLDQGPYVEYDMSAAYCNIAASCNMPTVAVGERHKLSPDGLALAINRYSVLADVTVETELPIVPTSLSDRTAWPVGTFRTTLWDPELLLALRHGRVLRVHRAYLYHRAPALQAFAQWVLTGMSHPAVCQSANVQKVLRHWSRALVGRLGLRYRSWVKFGETPIPDLRLVTYVDVDDGTSTDMLCAGYDRLLLSNMGEALESLPQVPSWVMSECRRRLWEACTSMGLDNVIYMDTDSMILRHVGRDVPPHDPTGASQQPWHKKGVYNVLQIRGPRNLDVESARRVSGLPVAARQTAPLEYSGQIMRSIKDSMRTGELDSVSTVPRNFVLKAVDLRRHHLPDHQTQPYRLEP
jgi:hypothetical protein